MPLLDSVNFQNGVPWWLLKATSSIAVVTSQETSSSDTSKTVPAVVAVATARFIFEIYEQVNASVHKNTASKLTFAQTTTVRIERIY